jgi:succinoglycan biosynthesis transport protein ExoP
VIRPLEVVPRHYEPLPPAAPRIPPAPAAERPPTLAAYAAAAWNRKGTLAGAAILSALATYALTSLQVPVYQAQANLEIQGLNENFLHLNEVTPNAGFYGTDGYLQTQADVLQSRALIREAAKQTDYAARFRKAPQGRLSTFFRRFSSSERTAPGEDAVLDEIGANLKVRTALPTRILRVTFDSPDPQLAADIPNALAAEYALATLDYRSREGNQTSQLLAQQLEELKAKLQKSEERLQDHVRKSGLMFLADDKGSVAEARLRQLEDELSKAQAERMLRQSEQEVAVSGRLEALPRVMDSVSLADAQQKLNILRGQLAELSQSLTPQHYKIQRLNAQIRASEAEIEKNKRNILSRIGNENEQARRRESMLEAACNRQRQVIAEQARQSAQYDLLKHEVDTGRTVYDATLQRMRESAIASAMHISNVRIIDAAERPVKPYKPNLAVNTAFGALSGLALGLVFVCAGEARDRRVRLPGDTRQFSNTVELGAVPYSRGRYQKADFAEAFRPMLASLVFDRRNYAGPRVIAVTSPGEGDGTTTVLRNLGATLGHVEGRVLLIDGNLHRPSLHTLCGVSNFWGLNNLLHEEYPVEELPAEALGWACGKGLFVLPCGQQSETGSELMYSSRLPQLIARLRHAYDLILIDTPPLLEVAESRLLCRVSDGVILVVRADQTSAESISQCKNLLEQDGAILLGTVLNGIEPKGARWYGNYRRRLRIAGDAA